MVHVYNGSGVQWFMCTMVQVCDDDQFMYCGTTSGDVLKVNMKTCLFTNHGPLKDKYSLGISTLQILPSGMYLLLEGGLSLVEDFSSVC